MEEQDITKLVVDEDTVSQLEHDEEYDTWKVYTFIDDLWFEFDTKGEATLFQSDWDALFTDYGKSVRGSYTAHEEGELSD